MKENLYFPVYQKIENEVINLTSSIYFSDEQIIVYSLQIADLIIRCSIELESIAKDDGRSLTNLINKILADYVEDTHK